MPPSLSRLLTARVVPQFLERCPRVLLAVHEANSSALCASLGTGEIDMAVMSSAEPTQDVWLQIFASEPFALIGQPSARYADRTVIALADIMDLPLILVSRPNALRKLLDQKFSERAVSPKVVAEANSLIAVAMVQAGIGATILPSSAAWEALQAGNVCCVPVQGLRMTWAVACQKSNPLSAAGMRFFEILRAQTAAAIGSGEWGAVAV
jgi:LysR family nitrogen assimilation transcriptional regulator